MRDLDCGCRTVPVRRLCPYHEGFEDAHRASMTVEAWAKGRRAAELEAGRKEVERIREQVRNCNCCHHDIEIIPSIGTVRRCCWCGTTGTWIKPTGEHGPHAPHDGTADGSTS